MPSSAPTHSYTHIQTHMYSQCTRTFKQTTSNVIFCGGYNKNDPPPPSIHALHIQYGVVYFCCFLSYFFHPHMYTNTHTHTGTFTHLSIPHKDPCSYNLCCSLLFFTLSIQLKKKTLEVTVWDYDRSSSNDFLGEVSAFHRKNVKCT